MILKLLIGIVIVYVLYKIVSGWNAIAAPSGKNLSPAGEDLVEDPICHTYVPVSDACRLSRAGKTLYFCSRKCLDTFAAEQREP